MLNATCKPLNSPLDALIAHANAAQLPVFLANALGTIESIESIESINSNGPNGSNRGSQTAPSPASVAARLALLTEHLSALGGSDLFVTGIINPMNEHPALPTAHLTRLAQAAKEQMEQALGSSLAQRLQQLESQAEKAAERTNQLEREVLDLTQARTQLAAQLRARKEALELRAGPGDEEGRLQQALDRKRGEVKQLTRETAQLRKEVQELRGRSEQRGGDNIGSEKYRLMKRSQWGAKLTVERFERLQRIGLRSSWILCWWKS